MRWWATVHSYNQCKLLSLLNPLLCTGTTAAAVKVLSEKELLNASQAAIAAMH
jgi:hypothetical protein